MKLELLKGANGMCISLNNTRITDPKIYGILTPIMVWDVPGERIQKILDEREPVRRGRWIDHGIGGTVMCSNCKFVDFFAKRDRVMLFGYCPGCGAKMEEAQA